MSHNLLKRRRKATSVSFEEVLEKTHGDSRLINFVKLCKKNQHLCHKNELSSYAGS